MEKMIIGLTQEQIDTMVHESCVLFCKHCGCGIPRDTCTSLGTCKEHDEYRTAIRTHLMEKKKEYPKTYQECCKVLHYAYEQGITMRGVTEKEEELFRRLIVLKRCRDAYWKIAGEEFNLDEAIYYIYTDEYGYIITSDDLRGRNCILGFPTAEMRDAFKENFDPDIEFCKEFL